MSNANPTSAQTTLAALVRERRNLTDLIDRLHDTRFDPKARLMMADRNALAASAKALIVARAEISRQIVAVRARI